MAFILTTAATHFFLTDKLNPDVAKDSKSVGTALSPGSKFLFDTVLKANNNRPLQPLSRAFVLSEGNPIDDSMQVVSWCDGDIQQVATIVEEESLEKFKSLKITANKQSAARSATEQAADLAKVFKSQHALQRMTTVQNVDPVNHPMKRTLQQGFVKMAAKELNLKLDKRKALIDFLACIPEVLTTAGKRSNVVHGFVANGLVGDEAKFKSKFAFPDFDLMLATVRRKVTTTEHNLCKRIISRIAANPNEAGFCF